MTLVSLAWNYIIPSKVRSSDDNEPETAQGQSDAAAFGRATRLSCGAADVLQGSIDD